MVMIKRKKYVEPSTGSAAHGRFWRQVPSILLLLLLLGESAVGAFVIRDLTRSYTAVQKMYSGSVQRLLRFGDLQYHAQETRRTTLYALTTNDGNLQVDYADQSRNADRIVTQGIAAYLTEARTPQEADAGHRLANDWSAYLQVRDDVLGRILESSPEEAVQLDLKSGVSQFERVRQDLNEIEESYHEHAAQQLATIQALLRRSMTRLLLALAFGLLFGSFAIWAIQEARLHSAVQLANLQIGFVASVSHELRTPITAILSAAENLRDGMVTKREDIVEQSTVMADQAVRLANLVDQVLLFASPAPSGQSQGGEVQVHEIVEDALRCTGSMLQGNGFIVEKQIAPGLPLVVGDRAVLSQCLQNLIVNAVKYGAANKWIRVSAIMNERRHELEIRVQDQGMGINASDLPHIFEPFYRSPQAVRAHIKGTGLGLSIAKRSAEAFGGTLSVCSKVGVGTVFTLSLPAAGQPSEDRQFSDVPREGIPT